jgi:moderate conductance mechanosensitive channel
MRSLLHLLERHGVPDAAAKTLVIVGVFAVAWLVGRLATSLARWLERGIDHDDHPSPLVALSRRETAVSLTRTTVRYIAFVVALALAVVVLTGGRTAGTIAGASFFAVIIGFAAQRFLIDIVAGLLMFFEGWYTVGTSIVFEPWKLEGVVEEVSLRSTAIRDVNGDLIRINHSQVLAVRVLPDGARRVEIELYVRDLDAGTKLVERIAQMVPAGPTAFVSPPQLRDTEELGEGLYRITATASLAPGRLWLATDLLPSLIKEVADGIVVHGPVIVPANEQALSRFSRAERRGRRATADSNRHRPG